MQSVSSNATTKPSLYYAATTSTFNASRNGHKTSAHYAGTISNHQLSNFVKNVINVKGYGCAWFAGRDYVVGLIMIF